jgi:hypothetical protein
MPGTKDYNAFLRTLGSAKFTQLWPAQDAVLEEYAANFTEKTDVAVELPTGAGKTLVALLAAEAWRQEGKKVAILSANKTLARQMRSEAQALNILAVLMEGRGEEIPAADKRAYQRATAVAIMNYWVYFNQNPVVDPADLLIMDDAHLMEHCLHSLYSAEIDRHRHADLFGSIVQELQSRFPEYSVLSDALESGVESNAPPELLSFFDQVDASDRIREIIDTSPYLRSDIDLNFRWRRLRPSLDDANIYLSLHSIWIRPYVYPLISNFHYEEAQQRLYMSATVGEPGDLARRLGIRNIEKIPVPQEFAERTFGRRLLVMNQIEDKDLPVRLQRVILATLRIHPKSVWLCSSDAEAIKIQAAVSDWLNDNGLVGQPTWKLTSNGDEIDQFKAAPAGHLFVAGRFDGMDFSANECRLVIITTLPRAINTQEEFISAYLRDAGFMKTRLNQRIVQAVGRCNRADDDYGVYVLADRRFATHFGRESNRVGVPRNIQAELDMAQDWAEIDEAELVDRVEKFMTEDFALYDEELAAYSSNVPPPPAIPPLVDTAGDEVIAWNALFSSQNYDLAANRFERCWDACLSANLLEMTGLHGWHWSKALFLQSLLGEPGALVKAREIFSRAIDRGGRSSWFNRMRASLNRQVSVALSPLQLIDDYDEAILRKFDDLLEQVGATGNRFERHCLQIEDALSSSNHAQFQEGLERLGALLGYSASRPRHGAATDCRWRGIFGNVREVFTFEAKVEHLPATTLNASDIGQGHNQVARARAEFESNGYTVRGTIVTHMKAMAADAEASAGDLKIIPQPAILALWRKLKVVLVDYRDHWSLDDLSARRSALERVRPKLPTVGWLTRALDSSGRFVEEERLLGDWVS